jgi:uncharacterized protein (DUF58 family)
MPTPASSAGRAWAVAAFGAALTLIAFVFDAAPLFVAGVAFTAIGLAAPAWVWASAHGAAASRSLQTERVIEDELLEATIQVRRGRLGLPGAEVHDPLAGTPISLSGPLAPLVGGRRANVRIVASFARRGLHTLAPPSLIVRDPLDLACAVRVDPAPAQRLLVLPRTERVRWLRGDRGRRSDQPDGDTHSDALAAVDIDGLRPYRPGTPASRIHWPAVARGAGLLERRLQADGDARPLVLLDARGPGPIELLDAAVRAAASLTLELARLGGCGLLLPGERRVTAIDRNLSGWPAAHVRLALVQGGPETRPPALGVLGGRLGPVFYVAAQPLERLPAQLASMTRGSATLVVPADSLSDGKLRGMRKTPVASFEVAGCRGFVLGARRATSPGFRAPASAA